ncbi:hypothetical protein LXL04_011122 [Taraxacum kok-saghyz]
MERRDYNRDGYSRGRGRVDRYYVDARDGDRGGYGDDRHYGGGAQDSERGGYGGDRYYGGGAQDSERGGYGGDRYFGGSQDVERGGYGGDRYSGGAQIGERGGYGGDRYSGGAQIGERGGYGGDRYYDGRAGYVGDRYYEEAQDDGRGGFSGETGAGYHPRGGGRDRNYPHPYNDRHQEQYGGSRRRESGSGGGRSQQYRTPPTYHRHSTDRVQNRSGREREARRSPVEYGQSVKSRSRSRSPFPPPPPPRSRSPFPSQPPTQTQNRIADRIQEIPRREVQCVPTLMDDAEYPYVPIKRPDHGTLAMKSVKLLVNHFPVKFNPSKAILRYDVDIKHETPSSSRSIKKPIPKPDLRLIQEQLCSDNADLFPLLHTAYDGEKNIYSSVSLPEGTYNVKLHGRSYTCTIKYGTKLGLSKLQDFLNGNHMQIPRDVLQALDVVMKANLFREKVPVAKGMYPRVHRKEDDLYNGVAAFRGSQQTLKVTSNGLVMCLDYSAVPFRKRMPVFDFLKECIQGIREVSDIERFGNQVVRALKGLKVTVTHRRTNQKYTVCGLSEKPTRDISFDLEDLEGKKETEVVMLMDYFREKWGKEIKHKGMPCLNLGNTKKPNYVPMEFCILAEDKRFPKEQLGKEAARKLKELSLLNPNCREREIHDLVHDEYASGKNGANAIKNFEVEVGMNMTEVDGRVMAPPQLKLGSLNGKTMSTTVDRLKCHWNLLQGKTLVVGKSAESDNNRGGNNRGRGRGRGGRSYGGGQEGGRGGDGGGRSYGGAQGGGRGGDGGGRSYGTGQGGGRGGDGGGRSYGTGQGGGRGGDGGGYYPRGGGRGRSYPQQHNNQHQDQYGGGRGRVSSGGGGGQLATRTPAPTNPWQNADRVPDRAGRDREASWSTVASGQSVESPSQALTQTLNRVADLQIQEVPAQPVSPTMAEGENAYVPIKRPDRGTLATRTVRLLVNHFPVKFDPSKTILRYDVDIKHAVPSLSKSAKKSIPKSDLRQIHQKLCSDNPNQFPLLQTAYDGEKNIYSAISLPEGIHNVQLEGRSYSCSIKFGTELGLSKLQEFLKGNSVQIPRDVLQALDVVMKANLFREKVPVGRGMYPRVHREEDDLGGGIAAFRGSQQSLKLTSNGLVVCLDYSAIPFRKRMPVIDFLVESIWDIRNVNDIGRYGNIVIRALTGLRVSVTHRRTNQKYTVSGLTDLATKDISFELEDLEGKKEPEVKMLTDYFREKWGKEIKFKDIPCLKLGSSKKPNYVPMEFCFLAEDRRYPKEQLGREAAKILKDLSLLYPNTRKNEICGMVRDEYAPGKNGANSIKNFDVEVGMQMTEVNGRVMAPPQLKLGSLNGKTMTTQVDRMKCHWNLLQGRTLTQGKSAERWAVINFNRDTRPAGQQVDSFIRKLIARCQSIGIQMYDPLVVHHTTMREFSDINKLDRLLKRIMEDSRKIHKEQLQLIVCIMADKHDGYKHLKWVSETQIGVITQCCLSFNAFKANDQFLANLGMKINAKLGGSNVELVERFPRFNGPDHFMFIGADVNHPAPDNVSSPSVAALVGSVNPAATRYAARVSPQTHRKEEIVNFGSLCLDLVKTYYKVNGVKPNKIVVFRDGVSDGQFDMVLNKEMVDMKKALYDDTYRPAITFVIAQKRHTTRLFLNDRNEVGNVPPGTVVDTTIVQPFEFDFYLCSHFGGMGTSKPTHYTVIWDEIGFTSDEMQKLVYHLCYVFARCTKPVSLVPPVYYADLVAYRGRMFQEVAAETESGSPGSVPASFDRFFYTLEQNLKDSMFFV